MGSSYETWKEQLRTINCLSRRYLQIQCEKATEEVLRTVQMLWTRLTCRKRTLLLQINRGVLVSTLAPAPLLWKFQFLLMCFPWKFWVLRSPSPLELGKVWIFSRTTHYKETECASLIKSKSFTAIYCLLPLLLNKQPKVYNNIIIFTPK